MSQVLSNRFWFLLGGIFLLFLVVSNSFFIVQQSQQAIVLEFGRPVAFKDGDKTVYAIQSPGLKFKKPFVQEVVFFDQRILNFAATNKEVFDSEKKNLSVTAFAKYRIVDPLAFYQKVTDERGIRDKMDKIVETSLRDTIGRVPLGELLTAGRKTIVADIKNIVRERTIPFGVDILDVRIVAADLPEENSGAIYNRMRADRQKEAAEYRAQGEQEAQKIRGNADGEAIKIVASAFGKDPEFYHFYRSMQSYKKSVSAEDTTIYLSPKSEFLKFFN
jgi:membrane protease subunit HflC